MKPARLKMHSVLCLLLLFNYFQMILTQGLISKSQFNSPASTNDNTNGQSTRENQWEINRPEEKWIVASEISCWEQNGHWGKNQSCVGSKIVTAHRFRHLSRTGLTGIQLRCTENNGRDETEKEHFLRIDFEDQVDKNLPRGGWESWKNGSYSVFAEGFSFSRGEMSLRRSVKNYDVIYHKVHQTQTVSNLDSDSDFVVRKCPEDHAICGVTAMMDKAGLGVLTAIGLKCCHHCVPVEKWASVDEWENDGQFQSEKEIPISVGFRLQPSLQNDDSNTVNLRNIGFPKIFKRLGKSNSTGFAWTATPLSIWTKETTTNKAYLCEARSTCIFKQLVGHCGRARAHVEKFCRVSVPIGRSIPDSCNFNNALETRPITSCLDVLETLPPPRSKTQMIYPHGNKKVEVLCDFKTDGGGWTLIQTKSKGRKYEFNIPLNVYTQGFGSLDGNFWIGLENIRALTQNGDQELRVDLENFEGEKRWAKYSNFSISDASDFYRLSISGFYENSTAGDSMTNPAYGIEHLNNGMWFSTKDNYTSWDCISGFGGGGWWYNNCSKSSLNGPYVEKGVAVRGYHGIFWYSWTGWNTSLAKAEMKIRTRKLQ